MSDTTPPGDITATHPTARHLRAADAPAPSGPDPRPITATFPADASTGHDTVTYGPDIPDERTYRLLGNLDGKRVLELGSGSGHAAITMARQGARVITVDPSRERLDRVRHLCEREEVKVELREGDLADLAFVRADTFDLVLSVYAIATLDDADRAFRQVHRVLRTECPFVLSVPHPAFCMLDPSGADPLRLTRTYWDPSPRQWETEHGSGAEHPHTIGDLFTSLSRANFRVDTIIEPEPPAGAVQSPYWRTSMAWVPSTLLLRARKEGI